MKGLLHARHVEVDEARELARSLLAEQLPRRWAHTQGVAGRARDLAPLAREDARLLEASAWLHDIGYSPTLIGTGFHPLDGARYLRLHRCQDRRLLTLVAHHSCAVVEGGVRGLLQDLLDEFPREGAPAELHESLAYCDMTTDPEGRAISVRDRLADILHRYPPEHVVHLAIAAASPSIVEIVDRVTRRLSM